jgi:ABC-type multidrug transport system fused ATPase/permease subunit
MKAPSSDAWSTGFALHNVSFAFSRRPSKLVLKDVSVTLQPGQATALVGHSGSGKSTLAMLLARVLVPTSGQVCLGLMDLKDLDPD